MCPILVIIIMVVVIIIVVLLIKKRKKKENFTQDDDKEIISLVKERLILLDPKYESIPIFPGNESVTIDKKKIHLCLKDENDMYYNVDTLFYVVLHELAHMLSKSYSINTHNKEFQVKFKELLEKAYAANLLPNKQVVPLNYCKKEKKNLI